TLQWYIDDTTTGFEALGKTLTAPFDIFVDSSYCTGASCDGNVMFLSGGYDDGPDDGVAGFQFGTSAQGKVLYMLDPMASSDSTAKIAEFTTKDGTTDMTYAIVSEVTGIDENENGIVETLYVGNVGGEIIRIDLADGLYQSDNIHLVASLSSMGTDPAILEANERSIFAPIAVVELTIDNQDLNVLAAITGTRPAASENYPVQDKIYVFLENNTGTVIDSSTAVTVTNGDVTNTLHVVDRSDTYDHSTEVTCGSGTVVDCNRLTEANVHGWVLSLGANEMGIGAPIILPDVPEEGMYSLTFNTYNTNTRESRMYMVNLLNGDPVVSKKSDGNFDLHVPVGDTDDKDNARYQDLSNKAIGGAQAIKLKDGTSELLTSDGPISLPATVGINYRLSPANWTQIY
ncbi:MAG: hypothetical protein KAH77_03105, partial [Thiomargarita sp.]|nr:hypothetical protein [Thiomargarita sp.]